jgi:hypothetical protein
MSFSLLEISPKRRILFSSRFVMVDHVQSHWRALVVAVCVAAEDLGAAPVGFGPVALAVALDDTSAFFFPIVREVLHTALEAPLWCPC